MEGEKVDLRFTVLGGTVGVSEAGHPVALGGAQQRRVLAAFLAEAGVVVSADRLVEAVWPDGSAPEGARRTAMSYVSRLRAAIGADHLVTRDNGYVLELDGATYDAAEFEALLAEARQLVGEEAVLAYDAALALWSGRAFGDDGSEWWLQPVAARLEELRLLAEEERAERLIDCGRHAEAVVDLDRLVTEQPLRERFVDLLMRALYLAGRQAEALRAFQRFRDYLAEETGLLPSDALVDLEQRITVGDPSLAPMASEAVPGYELAEVIGEGAFGSVYRAVQPSVGREVAVKVIRPELADDPRFVQRFEAEAQLVARIEHPHVVPLYDYWRRPGGAFLVFRLLRGGSLAEREAEGTLDLDAVSRLVDEVGGALAAAHALGVVHRDVKPANILFDEAGNSYLADFGIAMLDGDDADLDLRSAGSPLYASPEQIRDATASPASDQYALAVVAWEALCGRAPFPGSTATEVGRVKFVEPVPPLDAGVDGAEALSPVLAKATAPHPADRFGSVAELVAEWRTAVAGSDLARTTGRGTAVPTGRSVAETLASIGVTGVNPYKGLRSFQEADAGEFCGRDELVSQLVERVAEAPFVTVVGPSGSGKSSLVHAGVVPEFRRRGALVVSMVPGSDPLVELEAALRRVATVEDEATIGARLRSPGGLVAVAGDLVAPGVQLVLVVDQFEELWTLVPDVAARDRFAGLLAHAAGPQGLLRVVATLRADQYDLPLQHATLGPVVSASTFAVTPMTAAELQDAIVVPAERVGVRFEPGLVSTMVGDVVSRPGALPLLQFALTELFERRQNATVTTEAYEDLGGIGGALARRAEDLYEATAVEQRVDVHRLFTELVTPGDDSDDLRRRATVEELVDIAPRVIEEYRSNRLIVTDHHPVTREPTVEVAHEALLREWPRLAGWIDGDRDTIRVRRSLTVAAHEWQADPADESTLYRGTRLVAADQVAQTLTLTGGERDFLAASHELADRERVARERANRRLRLLLVAALITLVLASATGVVALRQRDRASDQAARAEAASVSAEVDRIVAEVPRLLERDRSLAALLAAEAVRLRPTPAARGALLTTLTNEPRLRFTLNGGRSGYLRATGFPDGRRVAALSRDGVDVWDIEARRLLGRFDVEGASAIAVSHDGALIAVGRADGTVTFWDGERFEQVGDSVAFDERVTGLSFSPDDRTLAVSIGRIGGRAAATTRTTPQLVDVATRRLTGTSLGGHRTTVNAIAFSPDGRVIATGGNDGRIVLHDAATGQTLGSPIQLFAGVNSLAFSPDGRLVAAGSVDAGPGGRAAGVFDVDTHRQVDAGVIGSLGFTTLEFTADGSQLLVSSGLRVRAWDTSTWAEVGEPMQIQHGPAQVISLPDHPILVSGTDGTITSWDLDALPLVSRLVPGAPSAGGMFSPDGATLVTVDSADRAFLYRADDLTPLATLSVDGPGARGDLVGATPVAFSPDGATLAVGDRRGRVRLFDTEAGRALGPPITIDSSPIVVLGFSPDGRLLVATSNTAPANGAHVVDVATRSVQALEPAVPFALGQTFTPDGSQLVVSSLFGGAQALRFPVSDGEVGVGSPIDAIQRTASTVSYSPDGSRLAVGTTNGTLEFLDAETLEPVEAPISISPTLIVAIGFSADGSLAMVEDLDYSIRLVDVRDGAPLGEPIWGSDVGFGLSGFAPDGSVLLMPGPTGTVLLDLEVGHWRDAACELAGRQLTRAEWDQYLPSAGGYEPSC